jgi:hypothetical protein
MLPPLGGNFWRRYLSREKKQPLCHEAAAQNHSLTQTSSTCSVDYLFLFRDLDPGVIRPCPDATLAGAIPAAAEGCSHAALVWSALEAG